MTGTVTPACPLCGPGGTQVSLPPAGSASHQHNPASTPLRTGKEVTVMTATHRSGPSRMTPGPRRMIHSLRHVNDELTRAGEAIIRSARAPQPRLRGQATADGRDTAAERVDQAA